MTEIRDFRNPKKINLKTKPEVPSKKMVRTRIEGSF